MRVFSDSLPPKRRNRYSDRQPVIPQDRPQPRTMTRASRFGNEAGAISMGKRDLLAIHIQVHSRKKVHAAAF